MPYRTITAENAAAALGAAVACARDLADGGAVPAVLVPSLPAVARLRRALADRMVWNDVLGVCGQDPAAFLGELREMRVKRKNIPVERVETLMEERAQARKDKDFAKSDALRQELADLGVSVRDTPQGAEWDIP